MYESIHLSWRLFGLRFMSLRVFSSKLKKLRYQRIDEINRKLNEYVTKLETPIDKINYEILLTELHEIEECTEQGKNI